MGFLSSIIFLDMKLLSELAPGLLVIHILIQAVCKRVKKYVVKKQVLEIKDPSSERILSHCGKLTPLQHRRQFSYNLPLLFFNKRENMVLNFSCELVQPIFRVIEFG